MSEALFLVYEVVKEDNEDTINGHEAWANISAWNITQTFLTFTNLPQEPGS